MVTTGIGLFVVGLVVALVSFIFAALNMKNMANSVMSKNGPNPDAFAAGFGKHIGAMIPMVIGGLISIIGVVVLIVGLIQNHA